MIKLEQIQLLEKKIDNAVEVIELLKRENQALKNTLNKSQMKMGELENLLEQFKGEQNKIEAGIISALSKLDHLEDEVSEIKEPEGSEQESESHETPTQESAYEGASDDIEDEHPQDSSSVETQEVENQAVETPETDVTSESSENRETGIAEVEDEETPAEEKEIELDIF